MIDYISGLIAELTPAVAIIDCHGIGYEINISLLDYSALNGKEEAKLYVHESIREDAHVLFGFLTKRGREMFRLLIGVSGVGPTTARLILSSISVPELETSIAKGELTRLKTVKGIGAKTAQRIIVDLKDKIKVADMTLSSSQPVGGETFEDSVSALMMLGFSRQQSCKVLQEIFVSDPAASTEKAVSTALKML